MICHTQKKITSQLWKYVATNTYVTPKHKAIGEYYSSVPSVMELTKLLLHSSYETNLIYIIKEG